MTKHSSNNKKLLKELQTELKRLQSTLKDVEKREGKDVYVEVKTRKNQARYERIKQKSGVDMLLGKFYLEIDITAKQSEVFVPLSIASGKRVAGFMYQIEGTAEGSLVSTEIKVKGSNVTQVTLGTLLYARIPVGKTATFHIQVTIRGKSGKVYKIAVTRLNYRLKLTDARYQQYLKEIHSGSVTLP